MCHTVIVIYEGLFVLPEPTLLIFVSALISAQTADICITDIYDKIIVTYYSPYCCLSRDNSSLLPETECN